MADRDQIIDSANRYLGISRFSDYAPLGLQVEGTPRVRRIATGVSLSMALLERARAADAQMVIVHHGTFWRDEDPVLRGVRRERLAFLLRHEINLAAYHLPLDAHRRVGNNARLLAVAGARRLAPFGEYHDMPIGWLGGFATAVSLGTIVRRLSSLCGGRMQLTPPRAPRIRRLGAVSGGAGAIFEQAVQEGLDLFITGEPWEPAQALAEESGVGYLALGHYNSEKLGVMALGDWLARRHHVQVEFIDVPNPA